MNGFRNAGFNDRLNAAATARKAQLEKFRARPEVSDPEFAERRLARDAVREAREAREAERKAERKAQAEREAAEAVARREAEEAERKALEAEQAREAAEAVVRHQAEEAERKAARDARYAARKARQR
jgi:membrane protein involved in colicin uptake